MAEASPRIEVENRGVLRILTLASEERRNAISAMMRTQLAEAFDDALADRRCRAIVLAGKGDHFCAGGDLRDAAGNQPDAGRTARNVAALQDVIRRIVSDKPAIAAVEGVAFGAGLGLRDRRSEAALPAVHPGQRSLAALTEEWAGRLANGALQSIAGTKVTINVPLRQARRRCSTSAWPMKACQTSARTIRKP